MNKSSLLLLSIICLLFSCQRNEETKKEKAQHEGCNHDYDTTRIVRSNDERLRLYFKQYEIIPKIEINNIDSSQTDIILPGHKIKWEYIQNNRFLIIDNDKILLKNQLTINEVHNLQKDTLNAVKNWTQLKLYQYKKREIIAIEMSYYDCDDPSCSAHFYLLYDTSSKKTNFFGKHQTNNALNLYDFDDGSISFVSQSHLNYPDCDAKIFNLYTIDNKGVFQLQTKKDGKPYQIEQNYTDEGYKEFERLEQSAWIKKIK